MANRIIRIEIIEMSNQREPYIKFVDDKLSEKTYRPGFGTLEMLRRIIRSGQMIVDFDWGRGCKTITRRKI